MLTLFLTIFVILFILFWITDNKHLLYYDYKINQRNKRLILDLSDAKLSRDSYYVKAVRFEEELKELKRSKWSWHVEFGKLYEDQLTEKFNMIEHWKNEWFSQCRKLKSAEEIIHEKETELKDQTLINKSLQETIDNLTERLNKMYVLVGHLDDR